MHTQMHNQMHNQMQVTKNDMRFITEALSEAENSDMLMKHGCVVVESNKIIGRGWNNYRNQFGDGFLYKACSCHAEMHALREALRIKTKGKACNVRKKVGHRLPYAKKV